MKRYIYETNTIMKLNVVYYMMLFRDPYTKRTTFLICLLFVYDRNIKKNKKKIASLLQTTQLHRVYKVFLWKMYFFNFHHTKPMNSSVLLRIFIIVLFYANLYRYWLLYVLSITCLCYKLIKKFVLVFSHLIFNK